MTHDETLIATLNSALRDTSPASTVVVDTPDGRELLLYHQDADGRYADDGVMIIPPEVLSGPS